VTVRAQVHRHVVYIVGKVGAVIEIEAAQEILVGLAGARMLNGDEPRDDLQQLRDAQQGPHRKVGATHRTFARRAGAADLCFATSEHDHFFQHICGGRDIADRKQCKGNDRDRAMRMRSSHIDTTPGPMNAAELRGAAGLARYCYGYDAVVNVK
jgi:hypothetical protein